MVHVQCLAAVLFSTLFGLTTVVHLVQAIHYRKKFCWVIIMAGTWETAGLVLRVLSVLNTTSSSFGTPSQLLILLSPLWINAFLYDLTSRLVAQRLSLCFVLLDITAFLMQAGGASFISSDNPKTALLEIHIYMGGIGLQQSFVLGFISLVIRFHYKMKRLTAAGAASTQWQRPLYVLYTSLALITLRIVFRLIEFSSGVYSPITMHEAPFYCLEALPMFAALVLWNIFHPGTVLIRPNSEFPKKQKKSKNGGGDPEKDSQFQLPTPPE
ncbi:RTA1 like protein-domain-containing protein [Mycena galopus ATCC 62051]|nr:RTA1 like protein-domain-containing protein [Mycena galopus ATCC 62051]